LDDAATFFEPAIRREAILLYTLEEARRAQGKDDLAEAAAAQVLAIRPENLAVHRATGMAAQQLGLLRAAEREYRHVLTRGPIDSVVAIDASLKLADMLADQLRYRDAAEVLGATVNAADNQASVAKELGRLRPTGGLAGVRARLEHYRASHCHLQGDAAQESQHLDKALEYDPTDADVLISMYRLKDSTPERRTKTMSLIQKAAEQAERKIQTSKNDLNRAIACNQYAWLAANTQGDLDKALRYSQTAVEVLPDSAANLDTLAHCYYARGDYQSAVKYQTQANQLEPHSGAIARQLEVFRQALRQSQQVQPPEPR
jgi:tetratricopeptide (TPR) repeat protein